MKKQWFGEIAEYLVSVVAFLTYTLTKKHEQSLCSSSLYFRGTHGRNKADKPVAERPKNRYSTQCHWRSTFM